jgi:hypothetical protein
VIEALKPLRTVEPESASERASRYVRSYLLMRVFVGALGVALPFLLVLFDKVAFDGPFLRGSLSAYYYTGSRELFVGALCAIAIFLVTYKVAERNLDNTLSLAAGAGVLLVALFPTGLSEGVTDTTPLQDLLGERLVEVVHFTAAAIFIVSLGVITYYFGVREGNRDPQPGKRSPQFWQRYHWACAATIGLALLWIVVTMAVDWPNKALLIGEVASVWAFAASWLMKGLELEILQGTRPAADPEAAAETA